MSAPLEVLTRHGVEIALALTLVLALGALAVRVHRSPVSRHRIAEWTLGLAMLAALLLLLPLPRWRASETPGAGVPAALARWRPAPLGLEAVSSSRRVSRLPDPAATYAPAPVRQVVAAESRHEAAPPPETAPSISTARWLSLGFLLGAAGFALHLAVSLWWLRRLVRRARPAPAWVQALAPGIERARVLVSTETERPFCCFALRGGTIVLPASLVARHQQRRLRVVLLHERAHLEQGHGRTRLVAALAAPLFYWQPLYWWLVRASRRDAELVADDIASGSMDKRDYAAELLGLVESTHRTNLVVATGPSALGSRRNFLERMETLLMRRTPLTLSESRLQFAGRTTLALTLLATVTLAFGHTPQQGEPDEKGSVPFLSGIPILADRFQDGEGPTEPEGVPFLQDIPTIGSLFQSAEDGAKDGPSDSASAAGPVEIRFGDLAGLLELQERCWAEGGRVEILTLRRASKGVHEIAGLCRLTGLTAEARARIFQHSYGSSLLLYPEFDNGPSPEVAIVTREIRQLEFRLEQLERERIDLERALASKRLERDRLLGITARPAAKPIRGMVLGAMSQSNHLLVVIDRGTDQGVEVGTVFEIYREATYKGRVEVVRVEADRCYCSGKSHAESLPMSPGDRATTEL